jgi:3,4-dihydroxy 2-butanone 4-phosphate synthase/GTP cyclohydrolase II
VDGAFNGRLTPSETSSLRVERAAGAIRNAEPIVLWHDHGNQAYSSMVLAASDASKESIAYMLRHTSGVLTGPMPASTFKELGLQLQAGKPRHEHGMLGVTVDARSGTSTGISASDRARTFQALADNRTQPDDLARPGHVVPVRARANGVFANYGSAECTVDLLRFAGAVPVGAAAALIDNDGSLLSLNESVAFAKRQGLPFITADDIVDGRLFSEDLILQSSEAPVVLGGIRGQVRIYDSVLNGAKHPVFLIGSIHPTTPTLIYVHSGCALGATFGSTCQCGHRLMQAAVRLHGQGGGVIVSLTGMGTPVGLCDSSASEPNTPIAESERSVVDHLVTLVLRDLGCRQVRWLVDSPIPSISPRIEVVGCGSPGIEPCGEPLHIDDAGPDPQHHAS